jgi:uncharacterized protein YciI
MNATPAIIPIAPGKGNPHLTTRADLNARLRALRESGVFTILGGKFPEDETVRVIHAATNREVLAALETSPGTYLVRMVRNLFS